MRDSIWAQICLTLIMHTIMDVLLSNVITASKSKSQYWEQRSPLAAHIYDMNIQ